MTEVHTQCYVIQNKLGLYVEKVDSWGKTMTPDLQRARIYTAERYARRTLNTKVNYGPNMFQADGCEIVPVTISLT